jgi:hypothetical protein
MRGAHTAPPGLRRYHRRIPITLGHLRRHAIGRSLFKRTTLWRAIGKLGFVQADPIRAFLGQPRQVRSAPVSRCTKSDLR